MREASLGLGERARAGFGGSPLRRTFAGGLGQCAADAGGVEIGAIDRGAGLLASGFIEATGIYAIETELVQQRDHNALVLTVVAGDREGEVSRAACRTAELHQVFGIDIVEGFDHGTPQLMLDPTAFRHAILDIGDYA